MFAKAKAMYKVILQRKRRKRKKSDVEESRLRGY
jgi:hypothetical protein